MKETFMHRETLVTTLGMETTCIFNIKALYRAALRLQPSLDQNVADTTTNDMKDLRTTPILQRKHKILLDDYKVRPELSNHKNI